MISTKFIPIFLILLLICLPNKSLGSTGMEEVEEKAATVKDEVDKVPNKINGSEKNSNGNISQLRAEELYSNALSVGGNSHIYYDFTLLRRRRSIRNRMHKLHSEAKHLHDKDNEFTKISGMPHILDRKSNNYLNSETLARLQKKSQEKPSNKNADSSNGESSGSTGITRIDQEKSDHQ